MQMSFKLLPLSVLLIGAAACSAGAKVESLQATIDQQLSANAQRYGIAGQAVLILHNGELLYRGSHGLANLETKRPVTADDVFPAFSLSKLFASVLVMQLVERGVLDLDAPASRYVRDLPERWHHIKVNEFLDHVSGVPEYFDASNLQAPLPANRDAVFRLIADKPLLFAAGTETRYTQTNFLVLQAILEAHYAMRYRQIVSNEIIEPLRLNSTYLGKDHLGTREVVQSYIGKNRQLVKEDAIDWREYSIVHAELYITIDDLGTFLNALCAGRLLQQGTLQRLWKPYRYRSGGTGWFAAGWEYGTENGFQYVGHDGGTKVRVRLMFKDSLAENTYAIIYLTNGSADNVWSRTLVESVTQAALSQR
jgi:CubicO group peptidase (beta-lactamase class C family)